LGFDDLRESQAVEIVHRLAEEKIGELLIVEPHIFTLPPELSRLGLELYDFDGDRARQCGFVASRPHELSSVGSQRSER
jgi:UDP-N-acetyl-D-mannosaminuronate dehydrogenase